MKIAEILASVKSSVENFNVLQDAVSNAIAARDAAKAAVVRVLDDGIKSLQDIKDSLEEKKSQSNSEVPQEAPAS